MNEQQVHQLLQRYLAGETSLGEERALQRYFTEEEIPASLKAYAPLFAFFAKEKAVQPLRRSDEAPASSALSLQVKPERIKEPRSEPQLNSRRLSWSIATGIAASIALLLALNLPKAQSNDSYAYYVNGERVYNQAAAIESAESKLQMLAVAMQKTHSSMTAFEAIQQGSRSLQQLGKMAEAYQMVEEKLQIPIGSWQ
ncbi:MAG: hypothetical protein LBU92_04930 [Prevotellaceae bacterium]|jgi:hypothetical protein|nr:hypothetical protein [Prevotellaceae bacterium]